MHRTSIKFRTLKGLSIAVQQPAALVALRRTEQSYAVVHKTTRRTKERNCALQRKAPRNSAYSREPPHETAQRIAPNWNAPLHITTTRIAAQHSALKRNGSLSDETSQLLTTLRNVRHTTQRRTLFHNTVKRSASSRIAAQYSPTLSNVL